MAVLSDFQEKAIEEEDRIYSTPLFCFCVMETLLMAGSEARFMEEKNNCKLSLA